MSRSTDFKIDDIKKSLTIITDSFLDPGIFFTLIFVLFETCKLIGSKHFYILASHVPLAAVTEHFSTRF